MCSCSNTFVTCSGVSCWNTCIFLTGMPSSASGINLSAKDGGLRSCLEKAQVPEGLILKLIDPQGFNPFEHMRDFL